MTTQHSTIQFPATILVSIASVVALLFAFIPQSSFESPAPASSGLSGSVVFDGKAPENQVWTVGKNRNTCGNSKTLDRIVVNSKGGVANSLIIVKGVKGSPSGMSAVKITQKKCSYQPHLQVAALGSSLTIANEDDVLHNVHGYYIQSDHSTAFNFAQPILHQQTPVKLVKPGLIEMQCDAGHTWMSAYVYVADNPYVVVTGADGSFSIPNLPPGTYTVQCWHEGWKVTGESEGRPNFSDPKVSEQQVTVNAGSAARLEFHLSN